MNSQKIDNWLQILASIGVILSLIFVGLQIQQSREIAIADIYQQRTALLLEDRSLSVPAEQVFDAWTKMLAGEPLDLSEEYAIYLRISARIAYWENNHFQYQLGLLSEEQWAASRNSIGQWARRQLFLDSWELERTQVRKSFADAVDEILESELSN